MNIKIFFGVLLSLLVFFWLGYKMGDSRGFQDGFKDGYSYDCQEEIKALKATHDDLKKAVSVQKKLTVETQKRLDSAAYFERYGLRDSLVHVKYVQDSAKNWKSAKAYNDSLSRHNILKPRKCPNGEISSTEKLLIASGYKGDLSGSVLGCK